MLSLLLFAVVAEVADTPDFVGAGLEASAGTSTLEARKQGPEICTSRAHKQRIFHPLRRILPGKDWAKSGPVCAWKRLRYAIARGFAARGIVISDYKPVISVTCDFNQM